VATDVRQIGQQPLCATKYSTGIFKCSKQKYWRRN